MAAGKDGLKDIKIKGKTRNGNYRTTKHVTILTEETQQHADKHSTVQLEFCLQPVPCSGVGNRKHPLAEFQTGPRKRRSCRLTRREESIVVGH